MKSIIEKEFYTIEHKYTENNGEYEVSGLEVYGMIYKFALWLQQKGISFDSVDDVYNNTSALRGGNRLDIHDSYCLDSFPKRYSIEYIWVNQGKVLLATVYDRQEDKYICDIVV